MPVLWRRAWSTLHDLGPYVFVPLFVVLALVLYVSWRRTRQDTKSAPPAQG